MVAAIISTLLLFDGQVSHTFANRDKPIKDLTMTSTYRSEPQPFNGALPGKPDQRVQGARAYAETKVEYSLRFFGDEKEVWADHCGNVCQGPPPAHASHAECDRLCDRPCQSSSHFFWGNGEDLGHAVAGWGLPEFSKPFEDGFAEMVKTFTDRGFSINGLDELRAGEDMFMEEVNRRAEVAEASISFPHVGQDPYQPFLSVTHVVYAQMYAGFARISNTYVVEGPNASGQVIRLSEVPMGEPKDHQISKGYYAMSRSDIKQEVMCLCAKENTDKKIGYLPSFELEGHYRPFQNVGLNASFESLAGGMKYGDLELRISGQTVFNATASLVGESKGSVYLPAGTRLIPNNPSIQEMVVAEDFTLATLQAIPQGGNKSLPVLCTQMNKQFPNSSTRFAVAAPQDGTLQRLSRLSGKGNLRSPLDQVRIWLYTDSPSYEQMAAKLRPMVTPGEYATALDQVLSGSLEPGKRKKLNAQLSLSSLSGGDLSKEALVRILQAEWQRDPAQVIAGCPQFAQDWAASGPKAPGLYARMALWLANQKNQDAKSAAYQVLEAVPVAFRLRVAQEAGLEGVATDIFSPDIAQVQRAVDLLKLYKSPLYSTILEAGELRLAAKVKQAS